MKNRVIDNVSHVIVIVNTTRRTAHPETAFYTVQHDIYMVPIHKVANFLLFYVKNNSTDEGRPFFVAF